MKLQLSDGYLVYDQIGRGTPLLFIHGYPLSRKIWYPQIKGLFEIATVITPDLRGHGESTPFEGPYSMDVLADDCKYLLETINIKKPFIICGLSMGGYVSMAFYRRYPDLVAGMILTSTRLGPDTNEGKANRDIAIQNAILKGPSFIADSMLNKMVSPKTLISNPELVKTVREIMAGTSTKGIIGALEGMKERSDSTPLFSHIDIPVLIIHGADDQLIPFREAEGMNKTIKHSQLLVLKDAGHLPNLEQPEQYNQAVREFISNVS
jgi:pimeloyl-ACP methyl ester carboxylesterase